MYNPYQREFFWLSSFMCFVLLWVLLMLTVRKLPVSMAVLQNSPVFLAHHQAWVCSLL